MIRSILGLTVTSALLISCAAGSGVSGISGYSIMSHTSQGLTSEGEQRVVQRAKDEMYMDIKSRESFKE